MRLSTFTGALLASFALASADPPTTALSTVTATRTVMRVFTAVQTGTPNSTVSQQTASSNSSKDSTSTTPTTATASAKPAVYASRTGAASQASINIALALLTGAAVFIAL